MGIGWNLPPAIALANEIERPQHPARMIPMPMGENNPFDSPEIDSEQGDVALEDLLLWPCVEEDGVLALTSIRP